MTSTIQKDGHHPTTVAPIDVQQMPSAVKAHHELLSETLELTQELRRRFLQVGDSAFEDRPVDPRVDIAFAMVNTALSYLNGLARDFNFGDEDGSAGG